MCLKSGREGTVGTFKKGEMQLQDSKKFRMKLGMKFSDFFFFLNKMSLIRPHILGTGIFVPLEPGGERRLCCSHESVAVLSNYYNNTSSKIVRERGWGNGKDT